MQVRIVFAEVGIRLVLLWALQLPSAYPPPPPPPQGGVCNIHSTNRSSETGELCYGAGDGRSVAVAYGGAGDEKVELKLGQSWWAHQKATAMMDGASSTGGCAWLLCCNI
jgi:hypothetical protein